MIFKSLKQECVLEEKFRTVILFKEHETDKYKENSKPTKLKREKNKITD